MARDNVWKRIWDRARRWVSSSKAVDDQKHLDPQLSEAGDAGEVDFPELAGPLQDDETHAELPSVEEGDDTFPDIDQPVADSDRHAPSLSKNASDGKAESPDLSPLVDQPGNEAPLPVREGGAESFQFEEPFETPRNRPRMPSFAEVDRAIDDFADDMSIPRNRRTRVPPELGGPSVAPPPLQPADAPRNIGAVENEQEQQRGISERQGEQMIRLLEQQVQALASLKNAQEQLTSAVEELG